MSNRKSIAVEIVQALQDERDDLARRYMEEQRLVNNLIASDTKLRARIAELENALLISGLEFL